MESAKKLKEQSLVLAEWIKDNLERRDWTQGDLARAAGLPTGTISRILNGKRNVGPDVSLAIAKALGEMPEKVFRLAGLLPTLRVSEDDKVIVEVMEFLKYMSVGNRQEVLSYTRYLYQQREVKKRK